jgi:hypothetical protein
VDDRRHPAAQPMPVAFASGRMATVAAERCSAAETYRDGL